MNLSAEADGSHSKMYILSDMAFSENPVQCGFKLKYSV